ncbi:MAG: Uma2 family endonuclease [Sporichthyaceae bacterium]
MTEQRTLAEVGLAPGNRPFTVADLEAMPDDGRRYELIDGTLLVTPGPSWQHQSMAASLWRFLDDACPPDLRAVMAPFAVRTANDSEVQPDVLVTRFADLTSALLPVPPLLASEVLSPSTQLHDRNLKMAH